MSTAALIIVWPWEFTVTMLGLISGITSCLFLSRLRLKSVEMAFPQWATTEVQKAIHSRHRRDPWKKRVRSQHKQTYDIFCHVYIVRLTFFFCFSDEPDAKKMASQSEIDSSLCTLNAHISYRNALRTVSAHSPPFPSLSAIGAQLAALSQQR